MKMLPIAMLLGLLTPAAAADVSGVWDLEMRWPGDRQSTGVCTFEQDDRKLSGTCGGTDRFTITGEVDDRRVTWQFDVEQDGNRGRMTFTGTVAAGDKTIAGSCRIEGGQNGSFTMHKREERRTLSVSRSR